MTEIKNLTVVIIDCKNYGNAVSAITKTLQQIRPEKTIFFTDVDIDVPDVQTVIIPRIESKFDYSTFVMKTLYKHITTTHVLIIQHDGYVLNGDCWDEGWKRYDYIGAPWNYPDTERCVGNGGFSLRSIRLLTDIGMDDFIVPTDLEDDCICRLYGDYLERKYDIEFAPISVADKFSFELREPYQKTFGFHAYFHQPFKEHVIVRRWAAMGDIVLTEPVLAYYNDKGYQVVLDCLPEMMDIFYNNPYYIKHISAMNPKINPLLDINLNMAYESKPKQRVLETYYEYAGIKDGVLRNSRLNVEQPYEHRLFHKYIVFHIDRTNLPYRDVNGVNWQFVGDYYARLGFTVLQVGKGAHESVGTYFHAETKQMLMYLLKGANAVCGIDSGIAQLAVALGRPTAIFFGNVNPQLRYVNFENIQVIKNACPKKELEYCYHNQESSVTGTKCQIDEAHPPCTSEFTEWQVIKALNILLKLN